MIRTRISDAGLLVGRIVLTCDGPGGGGASRAPGDPAAAPSRSLEAMEAAGMIADARQAWIICACGIALVVVAVALGIALIGGGIS
jgi:hypothetical protein